eukprot:scaffold19007_cov71-Phaeocystis_antarctica.AAC.4
MGWGAVLISYRSLEALRRRSFEIFGFRAWTLPGGSLQARTRCAFGGGLRSRARCRWSSKSVCEASGRCRRCCMLRLI